MITVVAEINARDALEHVVMVTRDAHDPIVMFTNNITSHVKDAVANKPYGLHRARDEKFFKGAKIISARKCARPTFTYTEHDCYVSQTFNVIKTNRINQKYLTALLNSNVVRYWLRHKGKMQGGQFQVDKEPLMAVPLVAPPTTEQDRIAVLVDRVLQAAAKVHEAVIDSARDRYQRLFDQTDAEIQERIYNIYGLTDSDIDMVSNIGHEKPGT